MVMASLALVYTGEAAAQQDVMRGEVWGEMLLNRGGSFFSVFPGQRKVLDETV
jgi:hypothetical protein